VVLAVPFADEQRLLADAGRHGHRVVGRCAGADELLTALATVMTDLVVVAADPHYLTEAVLAAADGRGVRLLVVAGSTEERRHAAALGIIDPVPAPFEWSRSNQPADTVVDEETRARPFRRVSTAPTLTTAPKVTAAPPAAAAVLPPPGARGSVIAVWGAEGAPGRTTISIALAAELAEAAASAGVGEIVALADADTRAASIAPALALLDEAPGFAAACRLVAAGGLDRIQFDRIAQVHRTGRGELRVLTGIGRANRWPELTAERIAGVLAALRDWARVTVVDVAASFEHDEELMTDVSAPRRNAATIEALRSADRVVAVGAADPIGLARFLRGHAELVELVGPDRIVTVVNKLRPGAIGMNPSGQVRQTLARFGGIDDPVLIPWDPAACDAALLGGRALLEAAPRSGARTAIRELVAGLHLSGLGANRVA
jgi:MinD-like ATPase involved in chromosome partitioning or flagellar assembly